MRKREARAIHRSRETAVLAIVPAVTGILIIASWALAHGGIYSSLAGAALALAAIVFGGFPRFVAGFKDIHDRRITVNVFVTIALIATVAVGEFKAAAVIVFIMAVAGALESYTLDKTRKSIRNLLDLSPKTAMVRRGEREVAVPVKEVQPGDLVVVRPGERISVDGVVAAGASSVNQAPITGESMPVEKTEGAEVFSGTLNESGRLEIRATRTGGDTTLAKIVHLVEEAQGTKAPIQKIADRFTVWFLPTVLILAFIGLLTSGDIRVAVSILLVACPCAFAIATPTAVTAGISRLARRGVLVKGGMFLELAGRLKTIFVDKTGTFTFGRPKVVGVIAFDGASEDDILRMAATAEKYSEHPLARSIMTLAGERGIEIPDPDEFRVEPGWGVIAEWRGREIIVGREGFLLKRGISLVAGVTREVSAQEKRGRTAIVVADNGRAVGAVSISDEIRPGTSRTVALLKRIAGIQRVTMLTGDNRRVAAAVAEEIGIDDFRAGLLPEQKQQIVRKTRHEGGIVGMIGDGINDAPSLALADVGIAMGAAGTDVAIETADVALMNDDLSGVVDFVRMSNRVIRRIKLNIFFSIIYNATGLILGSLGMLTPVLAVTFQEAGCITVVLSSTLLLWSKIDPRDVGAGDMADWS